MQWPQWVRRGLWQRYLILITGAYGIRFHQTAVALIGGVFLSGYLFMMDSSQVGVADNEHANTLTFHYDVFLDFGTRGLWPRNLRSSSR